MKPGHQVTLHHESSVAKQHTKSIPAQTERDKRVCERKFESKAEADMHRPAGEKEFRNGWRFLQSSKKSEFKKVRGLKTKKTKK